MKSRFSFKVHPAGGIAFALAFLFADSRRVLAATLALLLHESAHLLAMGFCGMKECVVELTPFGGMADAKHFDRYSPVRRALSALAGLVMSAFAAFCCLEFANRNAFWRCFFQANVTLVALNIIPAWPLDGARIAAALSSYLGMEDRVKKLSAWLTTCLGYTIVGIGMYGVWHGGVNLTLFLIGPYLCYASRAEIVSEKVRGVSEAEQKLSNGKMLPIKAAAVNGDSLQGVFAAFLSQCERNSYHMLAELDAEKGTIRKWWTEQELIRKLLDEPVIDNAKK